MRRHFHRCSHLRVLSVDASELGGRRRGGGIILEELCDAKGLVPCMGLADCDVLALSQKRDLLVARATRLREEDGADSPLGGGRGPRDAAIAELRQELLEERASRVEENRRIAAESAAALERLGPVGRAEEEEFARAGISIRMDRALERLGAARLDAIDCALDAMGRPGYGSCARCAAEVEIERLRAAPETRVCAACARKASVPA